MELKNHNQNQVKDLRVQIDAVIKRLETEYDPSRELALVKTKLQEAKMWAGQELGRLGSSLPAEFRDEAPQVPVAGAPVEATADDPGPETAPDIAVSEPEVPVEAPSIEQNTNTPAEVVVEPAAPPAV